MHAYGFSLAALRLARSYLFNRKQRTKINESFDSWEEILFEVPQGSILGPWLFNIFICDPFIMIDDINIVNYADDNTPFVSGDAPLNLIISFENCSQKTFWMVYQQSHESKPWKMSSVYEYTYTNFH